LTDGYFAEAYATSIDVSGNDIYVVGWERNNSFGASASKLWKNGVETVISNSAQVYSVKVLDEDVYIAGNQYVKLTSEYIGTYWKNDVAVELPNVRSVYSIFVLGNDVYVAGNGIHGAAYWKNGTEVILPGGTSTSSICVISNDASLKSLNVNSGTLAPNFDKNIMSYAVYVENTVTEIEVSAAASDNNATIAGNGVYSLDVGSNEINIAVTASNGQTTRTYTIYVIRAYASNNANLKNITVEPGLLVPSFDANITKIIL
jgi:hypothetical protein